jgi:hypothetical protein
MMVIAQSFYAFLPLPSIMDEKDQFTHIYKFTYFEMFYDVTSLNFFKITISDQMKQQASSMNTRSLSGFEVEDMIYPYLYSCADGAPAQSHPCLVVG